MSPHRAWQALACALLLAGPSGAVRAAAPEPPGNRLGINVGAPLDWGRDQIYADVIRTSRDFEGTGVDADGWPLGDGRLLVWADARNMQGTYALSFRGQAARVTGAEVSGIHYDPATNTTTARLQVNEKGPSALYLGLSGTRRNPGDPPGTGVTAIRLMRPVSPGSTRSYPPTTLFHEPLQRIVSRVQVVRFMDFLATNNNQQVSWSDRPLPRQASFGRPAEGYGWQGRGGPWEHVVRFANEVRKDAWINLPVKADDDYVRNVALLFRYGSDGVNPYRSPQANPVFPPLDPDLKLYVEYSNELWNTAGPFAVQARYNRDQALAEVRRGGSPLAFDGLKDEQGWTYAWRRIAKRTVEISAIFREVFGDPAMGIRVRPVVMTQQGNGQDTLTQVARLLHGYYGNGEGRFVSTPRPPSWHVYGGGGSGYYAPDNGSPALTLDGIWTSGTMSVTAWEPVLRADADRVAALGLVRVAYEGGPSLDRTGKSDDVKARAWGDERMGRAVVDHHDAWSASGGDLLVYYTAAGDHQWGFTQDVLETGTPKLRALDELRQRPAAAVRYGTPVPGSVQGKGFSFGSRGWDRPGQGSQTFAAGNANDRFAWASYTLRGGDSRSRTVILKFGAGGGAEVAVYFDGVLLGTKAVPRSGTALPFGKVDAGPGLHGLIVRAVSGSFTLDEIRLE